VPANGTLSHGFASMFLPGDDALGSRSKLTLVQTNALDALGSSWVTIVGISLSIRQQSFGPNGPTNSVEPEPVVYLPHRLNPSRGMAIIVRPRSNPGIDALL